MDLIPEIAQFIIIHAVRSKKFIKTVAPKLRINDFDPQLEYSAAMLWSVIHDYWERHRETIPITFLKLNLKQLLNADSTISEQEKTGILQLCDVIEAFPEDAINDAEMITHTQRFLQLRRTKSKIATLTQGDIPTVLEQISKINRETSISAVRQVDLVGASYADIFNSKPLEPTGVTVIDELLHGGVKRGELYGFIAPVGGGKTTTAFTLLIKGASRKKHVFLFCYEEGGFGLAERMYINACGVDRTLVENRLMEDIPPNIRKKLFKAKDDLSPYLHYMDMTGHDIGFGGIPEMDTAIEQICDESGIKPDLICVDWVGEMASRKLFSQGRNPETGALRSEINASISQSVVLAKKWKTPIFLFHQLSKSAMEKPPKNIPEFTDSQDAKNFGDLLQNCFAMGSKQKVELEDHYYELAWLNLSKARGRATGYQLMEIDGLRCRIRKPANQWIVDPFGKGFVEADKFSTNQNVANAT